MNPAWIVRTGRLVMTPVGWQDLEGLVSLKADAAVFGQMLGGVRSATQTQTELAADQAYWARTGVGMWAVREAGRLVGTVGLHYRADGRSPALRFAFCPQTRGRGLAREAAGGALRFAHEAAGLAVVYAVARESNIASRTVLGAVGMREAGTFIRGGEAMLVYQSLPALRDVASR